MSITEKQKIPKTHAFCYDLPVRYWPSLMTSNAALSILSEVSKIRRTMQMLSKIPFDLSFYVVHLVFGYHDFDWFSTRIRTYILNQDLCNQTRIIKSLSCMMIIFSKLGSKSFGPTKSGAPYCIIAHKTDFFGRFSGNERQWICRKIDFLWEFSLTFGFLVFEQFCMILD